MICKWIKFKFAFGPFEICKWTKCKFANGSNANLQMDQMQICIWIKFKFANGCICDSQIVILLKYRIFYL